MRIKEIELDNFKSFGKQTTVPILNGFTTISGPNGSGKSNIVDSLLFALGLSSTRTMRAERLPGAPVNSLQQALDEPQVAALGLMQTMQHPGRANLQLMKAPIVAEAALAAVGLQGLGARWAT